MYQFLLAFLRIFQNFPGTLGKKIPKILVFTTVYVIHTYYVCVKAKLTLVIYFLDFFCAPFPNRKSEMFYLHAGLRLWRPQSKNLVITLLPQEPWISNNYLPCHCHWPGRPGLPSTPRGWPRNLWAVPEPHICPPLHLLSAASVSPAHNRREYGLARREGGKYIRTNHTGSRLKLVVSLYQNCSQSHST